MVFTVEGCQFAVNSPVTAAYLRGYLCDAFYERPEREALKRFLDPDLPVIELGGGLGVVACLTNKRLRHPHQHVVVEANPDLIPLLERNKRHNGCGFEIVHGALAYGSPETTFYRNAFFPASNVGRAWQESLDAAVRVPTVTLAGLLSRFPFDRCTLISDIEGAECALVEHEADLLCARVATLIVETHPGIAAQATDRMLTALEQMMFRRLSWDYGTYTFENRRGPGVVADR